MPTNEDNCAKAPSHEHIPKESTLKRLSVSDFVKDLEQRNEQLHKELAHRELQAFELTRENEVLKKLVRQV